MNDVKLRFTEDGEAALLIEVGRWILSIVPKKERDGVLSGGGDTPRAMASVAILDSLVEPGNPRRFVRIFNNDCNYMDGEQIAKLMAKLLPTRWDFNPAGSRHYLELLLESWD